MVGRWVGEGGRTYHRPESILMPGFKVLLPLLTCLHACLPQALDCKRTEAQHPVTVFTVYHLPQPGRDDSSTGLRGL